VRAARPRTEKGRARLDLEHLDLPPWWLGSSTRAAGEGVRVRVLEGGRLTVKVKVPIGGATRGMKIAQALSPQMKDADLDWTASPPRP
jgi:hypothetical protein